MYHDRTAWRCAFFVGKKYGSKGYPQGNAAHMGSISNGHICKLAFICESPNQKFLFVYFTKQYRHLTSGNICRLDTAKLN
jgi:hypothetical protein